MRHDDAAPRRAGAGGAGDPAGQGAHAVRRRRSKLAEQLVESITGAFEPEQWHNEYRERLHKLIETKAKGGQAARS